MFSEYVMFRIISLAVLVVIVIIVSWSRKQERERLKKIKNTNEESSAKETAPDIYEVQRICLIRLEFKLIPMYLDFARKQGMVNELCDISVWKRDFLAIVQMPEYMIDWEDISCEILGDRESECLIVYEFPRPSDLLLAKYGAVYINLSRQDYKYFTLERSLENYILGSRTTDEHFYYAERGDLTKDEFIEEICNIVGADKSILQKREWIERKLSIEDYNDLTELTDENYQEFIADNPMAVVFFYDLVSPYSKLVLPFLAESAGCHKDKIKVGIYNVYGFNNNTIRESNNIMAMPTLLFYKDGIEVNRRIGIITREDLMTWLYEQLV